MSIGIKIRQLREKQKMSQNELALQLGVSQTTLHNIESGNSQKIDFLLMDKVCNIFDKDFSYFANDSVINNNVKENKGQVSCENFTINNHYPESILLEIQNLINENKLLKTQIAEFSLK
ncbi:MAG: helix-turn-helix domain-containing protein [Bacteroidetes bacterium]|nr:helix-turn-helix domain-containing protein [Bacteroidota bacterium]MCL2302827.1 helix-turn-helix domain-containing protein [Lentimicrobiaceae bacterium]